MCVRARVCVVSQIQNTHQILSQTGTSTTLGLLAHPVWEHVSPLLCCPWVVYHLHN